MFRILLFPVCLAAFALSACVQINAPHLAKEDLLAIEGVWRSDGYGFLLTMQQGKPALYHESNVGCLSEDISANELRYGFPSLRIEDQDNFSIGQDPLSKHINFERIATLPVICHKVMPVGPISTFEFFAENMAQHYAFFDLHDIDWPTRVKQTRAKVKPNTDDQELFTILRTMLNGLEDSHVGIRANINDILITQSQRTLRESGDVLEAAHAQQNSQKSLRAFEVEWLSNLRERVVATVLPDGHSTASSDKLMWGMVGNIAYLNIGQFARFSSNGSLHAELDKINQYLDQIMADIQNAPTLVLDISLARGGYDEIAFAIANRFYPELKPSSANLNQPNQGILAISKHAADSEQKKVLDLFVRDVPMLGYSKPVYLITSDITTSAAEIFTFAMRALPTVQHLGMPTNGSFSDMLEKPLPNGWMFALSNEIYLDPDGVLFEGVGIEPDERIELFDIDSPYSGHAEAIFKIVERFTASQSL